MVEIVRGKITVGKELVFIQLDIQHPEWKEEAGSFGRLILNVLDRTASLEWTVRVEPDEDSADYSRFHACRRCSASLVEGFLGVAGLLPFPFSRPRRGQRF